jgi:hypothetical protein
MRPIAIATDQDRLCTRCDTRNTGDALFCIHCGAAIQSSPAIQNLRHPVGALTTIQPLLPAVKAMLFFRYFHYSVNINS